MRLQIGLLGPVETTWADERLPLTAGHQRALLALLALSPGRVVSLDVIADALWNGDPPARAVASIRVYVSQVRAALGHPELLQTRPGGYLLDAVGATDVEGFDRRCADARQEVSPEARRRGFRAALSIWRGPALADLTSYDFARREADRLEELRLAALEARIAADLDCGDAEGVVAELAALTTEHPWRERLWVHRITALSRSSRQADALTAYREIRTKLADELGIDPSPELRAAERTVLLQGDAPAAAPPTIERGNLPVEVSSFIGRVRERAQVAAALHQHRIVTLTGVGGVGKTRLALRVAADLGDRFPDGVWVCALAPLHAGESVVEAVAGIVGIPRLTGGDIRHALLDHLRSRRALLLLDNCEHLLLPVAELIDAVAAACPDVTFLTTSREGLAIDGERLIPLASLSTPAVDATPEEVRESDAVTLFLDRATASGGDLARIARSLPAIADICRRLDGIPLAIELAAARVRMMSPDDIAAHLDERFRLLTGGRRTALARHQTLRHAIDWSYEQLDQREQLALERLSVFAGSFTLRSAEAVIADDGLLKHEVLDAVSRLVAKSLVQAEVTPDGESRYSLLETVRQYAEERLVQHGDMGERRRRHAVHFAQVMAVIRVQSHGPQEREAVLWFDEEVDNLRSGFMFFVDRGDAESAVVMLAGLGSEKVGIRAEPEVAAWATLLVSMPGAENVAGYEDVCGLAAMLSVNRGESPIDIVRRGIAAARRQGRTPSLLGVVPMVAIALTTLNEELRVEGIGELEKVLAEADRTDTPDITAFAVAALASAHMTDLGLERALALARDAVALARDHGSPSTQGWTTYLLGSIELIAGNFEESERSLRTAATLPNIVRGVYQRLARTQLLSFPLDPGEVEEYFRAARGALLAARTAGALFEVHFHLMSLPTGLWIRGEHEVALVLWEGTGGQYFESLTTLFRHFGARKASPALLDRAKEQARGLGLNELVDLAVEAIDRILTRALAGPVPTESPLLQAR